MSDAPTITIRLHAALREAAGVDAVPIPLDPERLDVRTPKALFEIATSRHPGLAPWRGVVAFGTDDRLLPPERSLEPGIRLIHALPPVSGG